MDAKKQMTAISAYARFVREKYTYIILPALVVALVVGLFTSNQEVLILQASTPLIMINYDSRHGLQGIGDTCRGGRLCLPEGRCSLSVQSRR
jgi:hypothetical protein